MIDLEGRVSRKTYVRGMAGILGVTLVVGLIDGTVGHSPAFGLVLVIAYCAWMMGCGLALLTFGVRRLHDVGLSGWWLVLLIIPLLNLGMLVWLAFIPGSPRTNEYGEPNPA